MNHRRLPMPKCSLRLLVVFLGLAFFGMVRGQNGQPEKALDSVKNENASTLLEAWFSKCTRLEIKGPNHLERKDGISPRVFASTQEASIIKKATDLCRERRWAFAEGLVGETFTSAAICEFRLWKDKQCLAKFVLISGGQLLLIYEVDGREVEWWYSGNSEPSLTDAVFRELYNPNKASWSVGEY